jgi:hypothetical protein
MASVKALNSLSDFNKRHFELKSEIPQENGQVSSPELEPRLETHREVRCNNEPNIEIQEG